MPPNLIAYLIAAVTFIVGVLGVFGLPALALVLIKFIKFKERELTLEMEYRQKSQKHDLGIEQRVQRLEQVLASLDHDVRDRLGIGSSPATSLSSRPDLVETPPESDTQRDDSPEPVPTKIR